MNLAEIKTSGFYSYADNKPKMVSVFDFVTTDYYEDQIKEIRKENDPARIRALKNELPFITPACICEGGHSKENIVSLSGFISIDYDNGHPERKNLHIQGQQAWSAFILSLKRFNNIFYAGLSASGRGGFAIIPLQYPDKFMESFLSIQHAFKNELGIEIEKACSNINRLRFASFNTNETSFVNPDAKTWKYLIEQAPVKIGEPAKLNGPATIALFKSLARHVETRINNPQSFANGSRHAFCVALGGSCAWAGIPVENCIEWIAQEYWAKENDFIDRIDDEIRGIKEAYKHATAIGRAKINS